MAAKWFNSLDTNSNLETYLKKAIPDTKLTIKKYADVKFEYLSFCLKVKEMDDEEVSYASIGEPLYRVEAGNIKYRYRMEPKSLLKGVYPIIFSFHSN